MFGAQGERLKDAVYQLNWYDYAGADRRMLQLVMVRSQLASGLSAYGYFMCSHVTFSTVYTRLMITFFVCAC